jgi:hypothetical protein
MAYLGEDLEKHWRIKDRRAIYEWAGDGGVILGPPFTRQGPFNILETRHLAAPLDSLHNDRKRETNICAPVRGAKTLIADIDTFHTIAEDPADTLYLFQDDKAAKDHAEIRFFPNAYRSPKIKEQLPDDKNKERVQEIIFKNGMVLHFKGPADSNLQSRGYRKVKLDEVWLYKEGKIEEARARLGDYQKLGIDKLLCLSQGGFIGSDWDRQFNRGIIHTWGVRCLSCGKPILPEWSGSRGDGSFFGMRWDEHKNANGLWEIPKVLPTIRFECEHCGHPHIDGNRTKREWNRLGDYVVEQSTEKLNTKDSFRWTAIIDTPWDYLVDLYLQAMNAWKLGVAEPLIQFDQKRMAKMSSEETLLEAKLNFRKARYEMESVKDDDAIRIITADRQAEDVYWVTARDWWKNGKSRRVWFGKCFSGAEIEELRKKLDVRQNHLLIDSGHLPKGDHGVYALCIRYGWVAVKGVATEGGEEVFFTHRTDEGSVQRTYQAVDVDAECGRGPADITLMVKFSSPTYAERVHALIDRGLWLEPEGLEADPLEKEYKTQMSAEFKRPIVVGNKLARRTKYIWVCPSKNNHAFDCSKMQVLAAVLLDILPDLEATDGVATN